MTLIVPRILLLLITLSLSTERASNIVQRFEFRRRYLTQKANMDWVLRSSSLVNALWLIILFNVWMPFWFDDVSHQLAPLFLFIVLWTFNIAFYSNCYWKQLLLNLFHSYTSNFYSSVRSELQVENITSVTKHNSWASSWITNFSYLTEMYFVFISKYSLVEGQSWARYDVLHWYISNPHGCF